MGLNHSAKGTINYYRDSTEDMQLQQSVKGVNYHMEYLSICT